MFNLFKKYNGKYTLRFQMVLVNLLISIIPIIFIGVIFYNIYLDNLEKQFSNLLDAYFNQVNTRLEEYFHNINLIADTAFVNKQLQSTLMEEDLDYWDKLTIIDEIINSYMKLNDSMIDIYILDNDDYFYHSKGNLVINNIKNFVDEIDYEEIKSGNLFFSYSKDNKDIYKYIVAYRVIKSVFLKNFLDELAVGALLLDVNKINSMIKESNLPDKSCVMLVSENNQIITSTSKSISENYINNVQKDKINNQYVTINGSSYLIKRSSLKKMGWEIEALICRDDIIKEGNLIKLTIGMIVVILFVIVIIITLIFNVKITEPLKKLTDAFEKVASGDFKYKLLFDYKNEITAIEDNFNHMIKEIDSLTKSLLKAQRKAHTVELEKKQFQLNGLQSQINAHFLYNTLHTIRGMALTDSKKEINEIIKSLVAYLRYITNTDEFVTLQEEVNHLENYLSIERLRFGNKFKVKYEFTDNVKNQKILKLSLQPIIENSIFHGLEQKAGQGIVKITAYKEGDKAIIKIMDNGKGINKEELKLLNEILINDDIDRKVKNKKRSIGLYNIHKRIQIYFGSEYGLKIKSWQDIGTMIIVRYPHICKEE